MSPLGFQHPDTVDANTGGLGMYAAAERLAVAYNAVCLQNIKYITIEQLLVYHSL